MTMLELSIGQTTSSNFLCILQLEDLLQKIDNGIQKMLDKIAQIDVRTIAYARFQTNAVKMKPNVAKHLQKITLIAHPTKYVSQVNVIVSKYH